MSRCDLFYQLGVHAFSNFGVIRLEEAMGVYELVMVALEEENISDYSEDLMSKEEISMVCL